MIALNLKVICELVVSFILLQTCFSSMEGGRELKGCVSNSFINGCKDMQHYFGHILVSC